MANKVPNFRIGIQLSDNGGKGAGAGVRSWTGWAVDDDSTVTPWTGDSDRWDPDGVKVFLELDTTRTLQKDVQIGGQVADSGISGKGAGPEQYTKWAGDVLGNAPSETAWAADDDGFDPDAVRIFLNTRPWQQPNRVWKDIRIGVQVADAGGADPGDVQWTPWASEGGGESGWAVDPDSFDFDAVRMWMEVRVETT